MSRVPRLMLTRFAQIRLDMAKQRGEKYSPPTPESMEWFNAIASTVWPLINPDLFSGLVDTIEVRSIPLSYSTI